MVKLYHIPFFCKFKILLIFSILALSTSAVWGQSAAFPYSIFIATQPGECYDDCRIIITIKDANGQEVVINPQTHNAQNLNLYPLYNVQYHYRNVSAGTNTQYDTVNNIQVTAGEYCIGVTAYVPDPNSSGDFLMVDTTLCNISVTANYEHLEASVLSMIARSNFETWDDNPREFCGLHCSFLCEDRGRIQLMLTKGKFPYHVTILDALMDTIREAVFFDRVQTGDDPTFADYLDYYTFDSLAWGDYRILVSDACGYSIWLTINIPNAEPYRYQQQARNAIECIDTVATFFMIYREASSLHDYELDYLDSVICYRFINPGGDTTQWYYPEYNMYDPYWQYIYDTLSQIPNHCPIYNDTIDFQLHDLCRDTIITKRFFYTGVYDLIEQVLPTGVDMDVTPDTCVIRTHSGIATQMYNYYGTPDWCYYCGWENWDDYYPQELPGRYYTCPLSYDVWSGVDSSLISHSESDDFSYLVAPVVFAVDTTIPVHITVTDARGCVLTSRDTVFVFDAEPAGDSPYPWVTWGIREDWGWNACCWDRYFNVREKEVDAEAFRKNQTIHLFESPVYNRFNFTAVCQNGEWTVTPENPDNIYTYAEFFIDEDGWYFTVRDSFCLAPGRYTFERISGCGRDTVSYVWDGEWRDSLAFNAPQQYDIRQVCDRLVVHPNNNNLITYYQWNIYPEEDNDEPYLYVDSFYWYGYHVIEGVVGGYNEWPDGNGDLVFTVPGRYIVETYSNTSCTYISRYDTLEYIPQYIDFDLGFAIICDYLSSTGNVLTHAIRGSDPYTYYLYNQPDLAGDMLGTSTTGYFYNVPMVEGQQLSVMVIDSCYNSFYINLTAASLSQSVLAWEFGNNTGQAHCEGDSVHIMSLPFSFQADYQWTGPNGFSSNSRVNDFVLPYNGESGWYVLEILNTGCSTTVSDSVFIEVIRAPRVTITGDSVVCPSGGVTLGFEVEGNGPVTFNVGHSGAPESGIDTFTVNPNSTYYHYYPILSENRFWAYNMADNTCAYDYLIDTTIVDIQNVFTTTSPTINTTDGTACYGNAATLRASSPISTPYVVCWYDNPQQEHLLKSDTIYTPGTQSFCQIEHLYSDSALYVTVSNADYCAGIYGTLYYTVNMQNGTTQMNPGESARLYDSGGNDENYGDNEHYTYGFSCTGADSMYVVINYVDIAMGDTLYIYSGCNVLPNFLVGILTYGSSLSHLTIPTSAVTFVFNSNWTNSRDGWSIDICTPLPMTEVYGHLSPTNYDTIMADLCPSPIPYHVEGFPDFNISQPIEYLIDTTLISGGTCETVVHLHLKVHATSSTAVHDTLMPCQLPIQWNGVTFSDFGTQSAVLTNAAGCDSTVTMTVHWAPPADSTVVHDTIVENQLPYHINGLTFNESGMQIATLTNQDGCDSIVTVHLFVHANVTAEADSVICDSELPLVWNGVTFTQSDTQSVVLLAHTGADSTLTMHLTVNPTSRTIFADTTCQGADYAGYGFTLSALETSIPGIRTLTRHHNNMFGCDSLVELILLVTPIITPSFYAEPDKALLSEAPYIQFTNTTDITDIAMMSYYWIWDFADGTTDTTTEYNNQHLYTQWGDFDVTLTLVVNDCSSEFFVPVIIEADLKFPNVITPNGDGINDVFAIEGLNIERKNRIVITDRWGKIMLSQDNYQTYFKDGVIYNPESGFGSADLSDGVYYYTFYYEGAVRTLQFNGSITVIH